MSVAHHCAVGRSTVTASRLVSYRVAEMKGGLRCHRHGRQALTDGETLVVQMLCAALFRHSARGYSYISSGDS
jgi:hypothetical protein